MKSKSHAWSDIFLKLTILITLLGSIGCFYPKAERAPGELVSDVAYEIVDETTVVEKSDTSRQWIYVDCKYWAGCFMRCDGESTQCKQLAKDSNFSILSVFMSVFD
jgi:hypothetical protein